MNIQALHTQFYDVIILSKYVFYGIVKEWKNIFLFILFTYISPTEFKVYIQPL